MSKIYSLITSCVTLVDATVGDTAVNKISYLYYVTTSESVDICPYSLKCQIKNIYYHPHWSIEGYNNSLYIKQTSNTTSNIYVHKYIYINIYWMLC